MLFYVNALIYLIILLENQVFIPDFPVGKLSDIIYLDLWFLILLNNLILNCTPCQGHFELV